jgi:SHS2 domain-containing protein
VPEGLEFAGRCIAVTTGRLVGTERRVSEWGRIGPGGAGPSAQIASRSSGRQPGVQAGEGGCLQRKPGVGGRRDRGHRSVPHTADLRIEAWGPTREDCLAEAVRGLVESFAEVGQAGQQRASVHYLAAGSDADLLAAAVEEVIYRLDADGEIPASVEVSRAVGGGIDLRLAMTDVSGAEIVGAVPKAASLSGLHCEAGPSGEWWCGVTVDV